jgi:hypothetical protein
MKCLNKLACLLLILNSSLIFTAEQPGGNLYIRNAHPTLSFDCEYTEAGQKSELALRQASVESNIGLIREISELKIRIHGALMGAFSSYTDYTNKVRECTGDNDWILVILPSIKGWDVKLEQRVPSRQPKVLAQPLDYFGQIKPTDEPRHVLGLTTKYKPADVDANVRRFNEQIQQEIKQQIITQQIAQQILFILEETGKCAKNLLRYQSGSVDYNKLLIAWRGLLHPERISHGKQIACEIALHGLKGFRDAPEYLNRIIDLMWYLYGIAIEKNQAFDEGTFVIEDHESKMYNFLLNYVKLVNPSVKGTLQDPASNISTNQYAYSRLSSHFRIEQQQHRHYGIDMRYFGQGQMVATALLPAQKSHILFGELGNGLIFIKFESAGIAFQSVATHAADFVVAQLRKFPANLPTLTNYLRGYTPQIATDLFDYYIGTDDAPTYRKERVPLEILDRCLAIIDRGHLTPEQKQTISLSFIQNGIHGIYNEISNPASQLAVAQKQELEKYLRELLNREGLDHQNIRYGREVIISHAHITRGCK